MFELLKTFDPDSRMLLKLFPDNVNCKYMNEVIGKHHFGMMEQNQDADDSFSKFALRYGVVAITPGSTYRRNKFCDDKSLRLVHTLDATHLTSYLCGTMLDILHMLPKSEYLIDAFTVGSNNKGKDL